MHDAIDPSFAQRLLLKLAAPLALMLPKQDRHHGAGLFGVGIRHTPGQAQQILVMSGETPTG